MFTHEDVNYDITYIKIWEKNPKYPIGWFSIFVSEEYVITRNVLVKWKKKAIKYVHKY